MKLNSISNVYQTAAKNVKFGTQRRKPYCEHISRGANRDVCVFTKDKNVEKPLSPWKCAILNKMNLDTCSNEPEIYPLVGRYDLDDFHEAKKLAEYMTEEGIDDDVILPCEVCYDDLYAGAELSKEQIADAEELYNYMNSHEYGIDIPDDLYNSSCQYSDYDYPF